MSLRKVAIVGCALGIIMCVAIGLYLWQESRSPKRVWVSYSEKYEIVVDQKTSHEYPAEGQELFADERLGSLIAKKADCIVITQDRSKADYIVNISVIWRSIVVTKEDIGYAQVLVAKGNGDVVDTANFSQRYGTYPNVVDLSITRTWQTLCGSGSSKR